MTVPGTSDYLEDVGAVSKALSRLGLTPVLVGGMALVILGSRRVTRDFDLKRIAKAERSSAEDALDIAFLEARRKRSKKVKR